MGDVAQSSGNSSGREEKRTNSNAVHLQHQVASNYPFRESNVKKAQAQNGKKLYDLFDKQFTIGLLKGLDTKL